MLNLLAWLEQNYQEGSDAEMVKNIKSYTKGFWKGLFTFYDHPIVPRTNNDHERFFRQTKTRHRRTTGLRSWNEYILRCGEYVVLVDDALRHSKIIQRLQSVDYENYRRQRQHWLSRLEEGIKRRRFRRDPQKFLQIVENQFCVLIGQP